MVRNMPSNTLGMLSPAFFLFCFYFSLNLIFSIYSDNDLVSLCWVALVHSKKRVSFKRYYCEELTEPNGGRATLMLRCFLICRLSCETTLYASF